MRMIFTVLAMAVLLAGSALAQTAAEPGGNPESPSDRNSGIGNDPPRGAPGQRGN